MKNARFGNSNKSSAAALAVLVAVSAVRAELPGLPAAKPADGEATHAPELHPAAVPQGGPVRGSLFKQGAVAASVAADVAMTGTDAPSRSGPSISFTAVTAPQARRYKKNDILTVIVREDSDSTTNGKGTSQKTQNFDLAVQQFLQLALSKSGLPTVGTVNNPSSLPEIKFKYDNNKQTTADQERTDSLSIRISALVADVKPNGTMVVEATKHITVDKEEQVMKLSGICRVEDISIDNTILSTQLADLTVSKQTKGEVHDVNHRGWLNKWIDQWSPF